MQASPKASNIDARSAPCIWMQAGVIGKKDCRQNYYCEACRFDRALRRAVEKNRRALAKGQTVRGPSAKLVSWRERLREKPVGRRPCLHHMKGRIAFRSCTHDYRCHDCEFDQYFNDQFIVHAVVKPVDVAHIKGIKIPQGFYLHPGHVWVKLEEGSMARIGLDDFARRLLGPLDRIEAPLTGKQLHQGDLDITIFRDEHKASLRSPLSGVVTDVNPHLREPGAWAQQDPYADGWLLRMHSANLRSELRTLLMGSEASDFLSGEVDGLYEAVEEVAGPLAADGGHLSDDIFGSLPALGWQQLTHRFLRN